MSNRKLWTCKDGTKVRIKDMSDRHLQNAAQLILRSASRARSHALLTYPDFNGEMAQLLAEQEWDKLDAMTDEDFAESEMPIYKDLVEEIERRGEEVTNAR